MAFADIAGKDQANLEVFVELTLTNTNTEATQTFYWSRGHVQTDKVDGTLRDWERRLEPNWSVLEPKPEIGSSRWAFPTAKFVLHLGDSNDDLWDYVYAPWQWKRATANVYLVDMDQEYTSASVNGVRQKLTGIVREHSVTPPQRDDRGQMQPGSVSLQLIDRLYQMTIAGRRMSSVTQYFTDFVRPLYDFENGDDAELDGAINATQTTITLKNIMTGIARWTANRVAVIVSNTGGLGYEPVEAMWVESNDAGNDITVRRGYGGTTAQSHVDSSTVWLLENGIDNKFCRDEAYQHVVPFVFGETAANRGIVLPAWPQANDDNGASDGSLVFWYARGKYGATLAKFWWLDDAGGMQDEGSPTNYNDYDNACRPASPAIWRYIEPHFKLCGSYVIPTVEYKSLVLNNWSKDESKAWVRTNGVIDPGGSNPYDHAAGVLWYMATNTNWALGLSDIIHSDALTAWDTGAWITEYSGVDYWDHITVVVPGLGERSNPPAADFFAELCDVVNSDLFYREGQLYPKKRETAGSADHTYKCYDWLRARQYEEDRDYCNTLEVDHGQPVLSSPDDPNAIEPEEVPFDLRLHKATAVALDEEEIVRSISRKWCRFAMTRDYLAGDDNGDQVFSSYWRDAHRKLLTLLAQPQLWVEAWWPSSEAHLQQGETIEFDDSPYVTGDDGQIREVEIYQSGEREPIRVRSLSLHIDYS